MSPTEPTQASARRLLSTVEPLSCAARTRALAHFARRRAGTPELSGVVRDLEGHVRGTGFAPHAQRAFASHLALVSRDLDAVARHLASPHPDLRRGALRAVRTLPVPDAAVPPALHDAPADLRHALYRALFHARRTALADRLLPAVLRDHGAPEAAVLLPACSAGTVADHLPDLAHAVRSWRRFARRLPDTLAAYLRTLGDAPDRRALHALDPVRPAEAAALADRLPGRARSNLPHASRVREGGGDRGTDHYPSRYPATPFGDRRVRSLLRVMRSHPDAARTVLRAMEPPLRTRYVERYLTGRLRSAPEAVLRYLDLLPPDAARERAREALEGIRSAGRWRTRHADPDLELDALAFLPYTEVAGTLADAASSGDARRRARGLAALVAAAGRTGDPETVSGVLLERAERARAERDPVRRALLRSAAALPVPLLTAALPALERLLDDTVHSRDAGADTRRALRDIAGRLLRHPACGPRARAWSLEVYARLVERFGADGLGEHGRPRAAPPWWSARRRWNADPRPEPHLDQVLPAGAEADLYRRLAPALEAARARGEHAPAVLVARELCRRAHGLPELGAHLRAAALEAGPRDAARAARAYLSGPDAADRARDLAEADPAAAALPGVWPRLVRTRPTDEVLAVLAAAPSRVPDADRRSARRWPARLTSALADRLAALADDPAAGVDARERALLRLGDLPRTAHRLRPHLDGDDVVLREAALSALGRCGDRTLDLVLRGADGPRSRAAAPALSRRALAEPPSALVPALARTLRGPAKVTVRKTAARLLARHRSPGSVAALVRALDTPGLHRDVRAAVVASLVRCLDDPDALPALAAHAPSFTEAELHLALLAPGPDRCPPRHRAAMAELVGGLPDPDTEHWRLRHWTVRWLPWGSGGGLGALVEGLCEPGDAFARSLAGIRVLWLRGEALDRAPEVVERLLARVPRAAPVPVPPEEDTAHRRLVRVVNAFRGAVRTPRDDGAVERVLPLLGEREEYGPEVSGLLLDRLSARIDPQGPEGAEAGDTGPGEAADLVLRYLRSHPPVDGADRYRIAALKLRLAADEDRLPEFCDRFLDGAGSDPRVRSHAGRMVLDLAGQAARRRGWPAPWPALLARVAGLGDPALRVAAHRMALD
ncbi:hypothetical protein ACFVWN_14225 [Nocardiopsis flavescens]|uniref:hypothetical protein n=1 Tax=Nocardiopsis flavescens TaxID=758803 RepID=UPI0036681FD2